MAESSIPAQFKGIQITSINQYSGQASSTVAAKGTGSFSVNITADSNADDYLILPRNSNYGQISGISRSGTTVTISIYNASGETHTMGGGFYAIGYRYA